MSDQDEINAENELDASMEIQRLESKLAAALAKVAELEKCLAKFDELVRMLADLYNDKRG